MVKLSQLGHAVQKAGREWLSAGAYVVLGIPASELQDWSKRGFSPTEASEWHQKGFDAVNADAWREVVH